MKMNVPKTKFLLFNPTNIYDFIPELTMEGHDIGTVEAMKLLGLLVRNDLSWSSNTEEMTKKGYQRLWMIKRLKKLGGSIECLKDIYCKQIRSVLEFGAPVWNSGINKEQACDIERVEKSFLHIVLGEDYILYAHALDKVGLDTLEERRLKLCLNFAKKADRDPKHSNWFIEYKQPGVETRSTKNKYVTPLHRLKRFAKSPIPYLTGLLNNQ